MQAYPSMSPAKSAILSLFIPGLGQMCSERIGAGLCFLFLTVAGYLFLPVAGLILHLLAVGNAGGADGILVAMIRRFGCRAGSKSQRQAVRS